MLHNATFGVTEGNFALRGLSDSRNRIRRRKKTPGIVLGKPAVIGPLEEVLF
jgi:hypothetical protein